MLQNRHITLLQTTNRRCSGSWKLADHWPERFIFIVRRAA
jgi:hypothetical protein